MTTFNKSRFLFYSLFYSISLTFSQDFTIQANPNAPAEINQLNYMIGEWSLIGFTRNETGQFEVIPHKTDFRAYFFNDGYSVINESFEKKDPNNFHGINIFFFDSVYNKFRITFINAKKNRIVSFDGEKSTDNEFIISNVGSYGQKKDLYYKEIDTIISKDLFIKRLYQSKDSGKSWNEMAYYYEYHRKR